ncbi:hypothetical protein ABZ949_02285 [Micromonospora tulbaghiae]|uniref:hypothetical protein n=1 Tax=Micromonospora tulbaghiae TaxID=479978 RepID=UPI0033D9DEFA
MTALATAFVRVRADTRDLKRETERDASQAGDRAAGSFGSSFSRRLSGQAAGMFAGLRAGGDSAGGDAGRAFGDRFVRDAAGRLRDSRGRFITEGSAAGSGFSDGFVRDAAGRMRDGRGRFVAEGRSAGDGLASGFNAGSLGARAGLQGLIATAVTLGPAIIPVAAAASAALAGIGVAAVSAFAGIGVGILAFQGIGDAVKALDAAQKDAGKSAASLSRQQDSIASAADGVRSAEQALAHTREQAAEQNRQSALRVADAQRDLTQAQRDERDIVLELNDARKAARQRLDDLNSSVKDNALSQRQSNLDVAEAKRRLDQVLADPKATQAQREQARITYEQEILRQEDLRRRAKILADEQKSATRAGIEGSREVQAVRERQAAAEDRVAAAQRTLAEAVRAQQRQQRDGAYQIAQAQQAVVAAQRSLRQATVSAGVAGAASMDKLRESMGALSPAGQRFAKFLHGLKDEFRSVRDAAAEGLLPGAQKAIEGLLPYLPQIRTFVNGIGKTLGDIAVKAVEAFGNPQWQKFFGMLSRNAGPALTGMFDAAMNVAEGFASIMAAFDPLNKDLGKGVVGLTEKFADWAAGLGESKGFQQFLGYVREYGPVAVKFFGDLFTIVGKLLVGLAPLGGILLSGLGKLADILAGLDPGVLLAIVAGIGAVIAIAGGPITAAVVGIVALAGGIYYLLNRLGVLKPLMTAVQNAVRTAWTDYILPALSALRTFVMEKVVPALLWLWQRVVLPAFRGISAAVQWAWQNVIQPVLAALRFWFQQVVAPTVMWLWRSVFQPALKGIGLAGQVMWALLKVVFGLMVIFVKTALAPVFTWLWKTIIKPSFDGIVKAAKFMWEKGIRPILEMLGGFIRDHVVPAFKVGVEGIKTAWEKIKDVAKVPVKFVVEQVINRAIIDNYNKLAKTFGVGTVDRVSLPKGFARGGILPGYTPGKDVHRFHSATGGTLDLSGGEAIIRPEGTRALGRGWVDGVNAAARSGGVAGVRQFLSGGQGDGLGDLYRRAKNKATDVIEGAGSLLSDPVGGLKRLAGRVLEALPFKDTAFGKLAAGVPRKVVDAAASRLGFITGAGSSLGSAASRALSGASPLGGSSGMMRALRAQFPDLRLISGFRPGSRTLSGNTSYHARDRAVDVPPIRAVAEYIFRNFRSITRELITPFPEFNLLNGRPHTYTGAVWRQHNFAGGNAHDHWAARLGGIVPVFDRGGVLAPGLNMVDNRTGGWEHLTRAVPGPTGGAGVVVNIRDSVITSRQHAEDLIVSAYNSAVRKRLIIPAAT